MSNRLQASFRDPSGFMFIEDGILYRQVNNEYKLEYKKLIECGLLNDLTESRLVVRSPEIDDIQNSSADGFMILKPEKIPFISYPYEWSFSQYKEAALLTLTILRKAFSKGFVLKDASAYNVQFLRGSAIFIDTLSFETYVPGTPWIAYRQFCKHFLAPIALMSLVDLRLSGLMKVFIDGIPLDLASTLLKKRGFFNLGLVMHIHSHAVLENRYADEEKGVSTISKKINKNGFIGIIDSLETTIKNLKLSPKIKTEWSNYYSTTNYSDLSFDVKKEMVAKYISICEPSTIWDFGGNNGEFSRIASAHKRNTITFDIDPLSVEQNYHLLKSNHEELILPLVLDLTNPSPAIGWQNKERDSLSDRGPVDCIMALALIHHLAITNNVPLARLAEYFSSLTRFLIIEFIPKTDSKVQKLLATRRDIFVNYSIEGFRTEFSNYFSIVEEQIIAGSERTLFLLKNTQLK